MSDKDEVSLTNTVPIPMVMLKKTSFYWLLSYYVTVNVNIQTCNYFAYGNS